MNYKVRKQLTPDQRLNYPGISDTVSHLLFHRGISNEKDAKKFISPDYDNDNLDPSLLKDADKAALRFIQAINDNEKIAIYSDYDADGIPGAAMFHDFLKRIDYSNFIVYIPHRHNEGFGLNKEAVDELAGGGVKLLITIDCGITDFDAVKHANEKGMTVIITDHHEPPGQL
ncbi:MAG: DHH family phosphoesterase, partial [Candidatus Taylorbacteria bacterium]|nr:DHH family phosphoesterase [Candidatus Taylorbacteria bacterium]